MARFQKTWHTHKHDAHVSEDGCLERWVKIMVFWNWRQAGSSTEMLQFESVSPPGDTVRLASVVSPSVDDCPLRSWFYTTSSLGGQGLGGKGQPLTLIQQACGLSCVFMSDWLTQAESTSPLWRYFFNKLYSYGRKVPNGFIDLASPWRWE
jgi:hypothetical protein